MIEFQESIRDAAINMGMACHPSYSLEVVSKVLDDEKVKKAVSVYRDYALQLEFKAMQINPEAKGDILFEVYHEFGRWFISQIVHHELPRREACCTELRVLTAVFFSKVGNDNALEQRLIDAFHTIELPEV